MKNDKKRNISIGKILLGIIFVLIMLIGGTFAYWIWETAQDKLTNISFTVDFEGLSCSADGGEPIEPSDVVIMPTVCTNSESVIKREITTNVQLKNGNIYAYMNLWLNINDIDTPLSESENLRYAVTTSDTNCMTDVVASGNFYGKKAGDKIDLFENKYDTSVSEKYYLYIWLDAAETNVETANQSFDFSLDGNCSGSEKSRQPVLDEGMIPVTISDTGVVTTISEYNPDWYDYEQQKWANMVLVNSSSRSKYINTSNVTVNENDIMGYYVWIPRYKYKIWTTEVSSTGQEQSIDIVFENKNQPMSLGTEVGEYRTHPAFWWDINSDNVADISEMLPGIWVGKFETTGSEDTPTVLPNQLSLTNQNVSTQFITSLKFSGGEFDTSTGDVTFSGNNTYGLTNMTDSHMMKNSEWGAVAYLSHSQYGINKEVRINNYYNTESGPFKTGCGALTDDEAQSTTCGIPYKSPSSQDDTYPQSTTGNITGVFDMSGGTYKYVMGYYINANSNYASGNNSYFGWTTSENYAGFTNVISSKYFDDYTSTSILTACNGDICYGHAFSETSGWYGDDARLVVGDWPWVRRGGFHNYKDVAGVFSYAPDNGVLTDAGFRSVLIPMNNYIVQLDVMGGTFADNEYITKEIINVDTYTTSGEHIFDVPLVGEYQLEVWGAQGGGNSSYRGGYGGYSVGTINLSKGEILYINVGGTGTANLKTGSLGTIAGGYNGGGTGTYAGDGTSYSATGGSGGGASHIATVSGLLSTLSSNRDAILIVAGGGGGAGIDSYESYTYSYSGGAGGGIQGKAVSGENTTCKAGTQTSGNAFGSGGNYASATHGAAGGGGGYYGGTGGGVNAPGCGGSGYIGNNLLTNKAMYCYSCTTSNEVSTKTVSTTDVSSTPTANYAKSGGGAARITTLRTYYNKSVTYEQLYGNLPTPVREGYNFVGWFTEMDGGVEVTSSSVVDVQSNHILYAQWTTGFTVKYDANGGSNASSFQVKEPSETLVLSSTVPSREGYTFLGWSTSNASTNVAYQPGDEYTSNSDVTLYAVWKVNKVNISYSVNSGTITASTTTDGVTSNWTTVNDIIYRNGNIYTNSINYDSSGNLPNYNSSDYMEITKEGYTTPDGAEWICLSGCAVANKTFDHDIDYDVPEFCNVSVGDCNVVLGVNWAEIYTISYNANGGSGAPGSQTKIEGVATTLSSTVPTRSGYMFLGWGTDSEATSATYSAGGAYTSNETALLYALWVEKKYVYNRGDLISSVTGGWSTGGISNQSGTAYFNGSFSQKSTYLQLSGASGYATTSSGAYMPHWGRISAWTANKVDVTNYNTLEIVYTSSQAADGAGRLSAYVAVSGSRTIDASSGLTIYAKKGSLARTATNETTYTLDISSLSGSYYLGFLVWQTSGQEKWDSQSIKLYEMSLY